MRYSVIIPVYNRPEEINELLQSLTEITYKSFEVLVIEDGSTETCEHVTRRYLNSLNIRYFNKANSGQGFSRNYGFKHALGEYFVVFDSDCLIPPHYFDAVNQQIEQQGRIDCWGGPDRAHDNFTPTQKAINYSMTSLFTTGGTRGNINHVGTYYPRSFNMGISREVFSQTNGYKITRMGEDLDLSIRIKKQGFRILFIEDAFVYHKRRTDFIQFYKQLFFFGRARINIWRHHPEELKAIHLLPPLFSVGLIYSILGVGFDFPISEMILYLYAFFGVILALDAYRLESNILVGIYSSIAGIIQLTAYGFGFIREVFSKRR